MNVSVIQGRLSSRPTQRVLPSGDCVTQLEVSVYREKAANDTVPVAWINAPKNAEQLDIGTEVLVLGRVRRRFFRAGGFTQSRTEVVAEKVQPFRRNQQAEKLLARARDRLVLGEERP